MITVFTPTYNRGYIIGALYASLCQQTDGNFEWLVVDDGSNDDTEEKIHRYIGERRIRITYVKQANGGKHRAINRGALLAQGELFFIVDSDDQLTNDAIATINAAYDAVRLSADFCGICGVRADRAGKRIGGEVSFTTWDCSYLDFRYKYRIKGDMAEVVKTNLLRCYPFPEYEGENFCPEAIVWNRLAERYKFRYINRKIYICEYLSDGISAKITHLRRSSWHASMDCYSELGRYNVPLLQKTKAYINYWRFAACSPKPLREKLHRIPLWGVALAPIGYLFYLNDSRS